ncbi:MAG: hypothetical protein MUC36_23735 [Planctomycetes bacterium]|jgi:hypothetical protein|nr:hypothetical protein [Planctomycetota bacterium]
MHVLATILADGWLLIMLLLSLMIAAWWGELAGIRPGRDKSGLGGFAAIYMFLPLRWLGLAILLPSWTWIGVHAALGALSAFGFERGLLRVQHDREVPMLLGLLGACLPVPAWSIAFLAVHDLATTGRAGLLTGLMLIGLHALTFLLRRGDLRRVRPLPPPEPIELPHK